jgi:hypothetical protein
MALTEDLRVVIRQLRRLEAAATPGPWTAVGHELYYGREAAGVDHQQMPLAADAALVACVRSWLPELLAALEAAAK